MKLLRTPIALCFVYLANATSAFVVHPNKKNMAYCWRALHAEPDVKEISIDIHDVAACFGRLGDKMYVVKTDEVKGTAASGYEFGILQAGRPKWIPCYERRSGPSQGGGAKLEHESIWRAVIFDSDGSVGSCQDFANAIKSLSYSAPLGAPSGIQGANLPSEIALSALWTLFGGSDGGLSAEDATKALQVAALTHNSDMSDDKLTYKSFASALMAASVCESAMSL